MRTAHYVHVATPRFVAVSPELLARRALLRRTDTKFLLSQAELDRVLPALSDDYGVLQAGGSSLACYRTLYFDSPELGCFHAHRRGQRPRFKVRLRHYADRAVAFVEVKARRSDQVTEKARREVPYGQAELCRVDREFAASASRVDGARLAPSAWTRFYRLTLLGLRTHERVTVDVELEVGAGDACHALRGLAVLEVKQAPYDARTPVMRALRSAGKRPSSASKYCAAIALTRPTIALNRLRPTLRAIERICT